MTKPCSFPWKHVHFTGIGGVGMGTLALILLDRHVRVSGTDAVDSAMLRLLARRGADVNVGHGAEHVGDAELLVFSSAVDAANPERAYASAHGIACCRRGQFLAQIASHYHTVITVAGSHGKTTTTAMLAHICRAAGQRPGYLVGGDVPGWAAPAAAGNGQLFITEVDESDATQTFIHSRIGLLLNMDDDHCWSLGGVAALEQCFTTYADNAAELITWEQPNLRRLLATHGNCTFLPASAAEQLVLPLPGAHNRSNAAIACAAAARLGIDPDQAQAALQSFPGVSRRMSVRLSLPGQRAVLVEDYAHHPTELTATLQALRQTWPDHQLVALFQPHRFERIKRYGAEFGRCLAAGADEAVVLRPFAAWVADQQLADPAVIVQNMLPTPGQLWNDSFAELAELMAARLRTAAAKPLLFAVIGAGDINELVPLLYEALLGEFLDLASTSLQQHVPAATLSRSHCWAQLTSLGVGLARPLLFRPETQAQLVAGLRAAAHLGLPVFQLGNGTNLVGCDRLQPHLVVQLRQGEFMQLQIDPAAGTVQAGAGVMLGDAWRKSMVHDRLPADAAALAWIPASVAGAVRMNAGAETVTVGQYVATMTGVRHAGTAWQAEHDQIAWNYRSSSIPDDVVLTTVTFQFPTGDRHAAAASLDASGARRHRRQPAGFHAGCVFRNAGSAAAGQLLDQAGCKNLQRGRCRVSSIHANFLVCTDKPGREQDFLELAEDCRQRVFARTGVRLDPEVRFTDPAAMIRLATTLPALHAVVLKGGPSAERTVSLRSGAAVAEALRHAGYRVTEIDITTAALPTLPVDTDVVFPALHGTFGEDGQIQQLLSDCDLPFVGSAAAASQLIMDKLATKEILTQHNIPTPRALAIADLAAPLPPNDLFPLLVKPRRQGSSVGMSLLRQPDAAAWRTALQAAFAVDTEVFAEQFIAGSEITVGVLHGEALPVVEIVPPNQRMFDYDAKYDHNQGHTNYYCPPEHVADHIQCRAQDLARRAFHALGARDLLRVDFIVDAEGTPWMLEGNSLPGFTGTSLLPMAAKASNMSFFELCANLTAAAWKRGAP